MRKHPTLVQFSQHPCVHWEMRDEEKYCAMFGLALTDSQLRCEKQCPAYDPWDCDLE